MAAAIPTSAFLPAVRSHSNPSLSSPTAAALPKTPFLAPSNLAFAVAKPSIRIASLPSRNRLQVRCQEKQVAVVTRENRWMYEESEINGPDIWNKTWYPKAADHITTEKTWYIVDATDKILGRLASTIAIHIRGKNLVTYTPSVDMGAYVIVVNAEKVAVSGKKRTQKLYRRHSGRPGGMKVETFDQLQERIPERIMEHAVRGMLPKGRLGRTLFTHLKVYKGPDHPHEAQKPIPLPIRDKRIQARK
uniref:Large ribosomal subunit protein uL13c n=1 Tax=Elaeis guineensis var. tenera TaxID=51953 RepID=A0A6I9QYE2_ELAGV|nr:50S ribosomal protein L13, chloroplastic [Elaeis guineensis]